MRGFGVNPYDRCIANSNIVVSHTTIVWHVNDLNISHVKSSVVDEIITSLKGEFDAISERTVKRGKLHTYIGMDLDFSKPKQIIISVESYIKDIDEEVRDIEVMQGSPVQNMH